MERWYLLCLRRWTAKRKCAPTLQALAGWCRKSPTAVYSALVSLEHKGYVTRVGGTDKKFARRFVAVDS